MRLELIKNFVLALLVGSSVVLSSVLWTFTPQYSPATQMIGNLPVTNNSSNNKALTVTEVVQPLQFIFSELDNELVIATKVVDKNHSSYKSAWSLFRKAIPQQNFVKTTKDTIEKPQIKISAKLPGNLPVAVINLALSRADSGREYNDLLIERLNIVLDATEQQTIIQYEGKDFYLEANSTLAKQEVLDLLARSSSAYDKQRHTTIMKLSKHSDHDYIQFYFNNPLTVRKIEGVAYSNIYTDGSKGLRVQTDQALMEYSQPAVFQGREAVNYTKMLQEALSFMRKLPAWQMDYLLLEMERLSDSENEFLLRFQAVHNNYLVINEPKASLLATVELRMQDNLVSRMNRSTFYIAGRQNHSVVSVISRQEMNELIMRRFSLQATDYILYEATRAKEQFQNQEAHLSPVWVMEHGQTTAVFDATTGQQLQ